jgi:PhnB protein
LERHKFFVCDESLRAKVELASPRNSGGTGVRIMILVDDVERAVSAGAGVSMPAQGMFWGERYGKIVDPFSHEWGIDQPVREQSPEETQVAAEEFLGNRK